MAFRIPRPAAAAALVWLSAGAGCEPTAVTVEGRLLVNGQPLPPDAGEPMIVFHPAGPGGNPGHQTYVAEVGPGGAYTVSGRKQTGIPPDRYQVTVELGKAYTDRLQGGYDASKTPFVFDVTPGNRVFDLDVKLPAEK